MVTRRSCRISKSVQSQFLKQLDSASVEKDVEAAYRDIIAAYYGGVFSSPYGTDGYLEPDKNTLIENEHNALRLLLEAKWQKNFEDGDRVKLIAQIVHYLKKFQADGKPLPNVIIGGDENEVFTFYAPKLYKYLEGPYDWSMPPSSAYLDEALYRDLENDGNVRDIFVFRIDDLFDINEVFEAVNALREIGEFKKLRVDEANLRKVFDQFVRLVFGGDHWLEGVRKIGATDSVSIFIRSILGDNDIYIHPNKPNILVNGRREIPIKGAAYNAFFSRYDRAYTPKEIDAITAIADRLIQELERRFHGDFWTPTIWADRAIKMITDDLGPNWRDEYIVWDPAAGTKNLTRDYNFKHLFSSTLHQSEIDMSAQYNKNSVSFQYDFLNDDIGVNPDSDPDKLKMPRALFEALKSDKPIIFYTNPPYGQATTGASSNHKTGIAATKIGAEMQEYNFGKASAELYSQFIFRVQKLARDFNLSNVFFFFFFNKGFITSPFFEKFTNQLLDQFEFKNGFMLNAGEFEGTSSSWGIIFSNFQLKREASPRQDELTFSLEMSNPNTNSIEKIADHTLRRVSRKNTLKAWLYGIPISKNELNGGRYPRLNGGLDISISKSTTGSFSDQAIGFLQWNSPIVQRIDKYLNLNSSMIALGNQGRAVEKSNFERACIVFSSAKSILPDASWHNDKDIFRAPSIEFQYSAEWPEFVRDCVIFSLFHRSSYQTALRNFEYKNELYNVNNEWFFMSKAEIIQLAEKHNLNDIVFDARSSEERFVYKYLHDTADARCISLSEEAKALLKAGEDFIRVCFAKRYLASRDHPEWHLLTWDAGYHQSYKIYTLYKDDDFDIKAAYGILDLARTNLEAKIRRQVYKDGILAE